MKINRKLLIAAALATTAPAGLMSQGAWAQGELEEIVVTGSYIKRNAEQLATPVDVFDRSEFESQGSPTMVDIVQNMPAVSGTVNRSEQFSSGGVITGLKMVNVRGMGMGRTLVLMNGKRMINNNFGTNAGEYPVDAGQMPNIALQRIELLKNGGSTTYGTDAMAGVFNFITRDKFEGFEVRGSHSFIQGSDGDSEIAAIYGVAGDEYNWVTSVEYEHRNTLAINDANFDTNVVPTAPWLSENGGHWLGYSSYGNPGAYYPVDPITLEPSTWDAGIGGPTGGYQTDPYCGEVSDNGAGSFVVPSGTQPGRCGYYYTNFSNVIDPQTRIKVFSQLTVQASDTVELYAEVLYNRLDTIYFGSPSYPPTNLSDSTNPIFIPASNPGFMDWYGTLDAPTQLLYQDGAGDPFGTAFRGRARAIEGPAMEAPKRHDNVRLVMGSRGELPFAEDISYDISATWSGTFTHSDSPRGNDILTARYQAALTGLGGAKCSPVNDDIYDPANDALRGDTASGCYYWNPFGSALFGGIDNDEARAAGVEDWYFGMAAGSTNATQFTADAVFSGELDVEMPGGTVAWAAGAQYRYFLSNYLPSGDNYADVGTQESQFQFLGFSFPARTLYRRYSFFGEVNVPLLDNLSIDAGLRFEDYEIDTVLKPKLAARWDALDWLAVRASYEQVFRTPIIPGNSTITLQQVAGEYYTFETPVPDALDPEEMTNIGVGLIANWEGLTASVDYYMMDLEGPFATETFTSGTTVYFPGTTDIQKVVTDLFNGGDVETAGIDFAASYVFDDNYDIGTWTVGVNGTAVEKFDIYNFDGTLAYEAAGMYSRWATTPFTVRSMPKLKLNAFVSLESGPSHFRLYARYIDGMDVEYNSAAGYLPAYFPTTGVSSIDSHVTVDAHYSFSFNEDKSNMSLSVVNISDEAAPYAPHEIGYDGFTHTPVGRVIKVSASVRF